MRSVRLSLAGMLLVLVALGGLGGASVAQDEPTVATGPEYAWVTLVSEDCVPGTGTEAYGYGDGFSWYRDRGFSCELVFSDPRVSGTLTGVYRDNCFDNDRYCVFWNSEEIAGPDGTWTGGVWGTLRPEDPAATSMKVYSGTGAYDGLTFLVHGLGVLGEQDFYGLIYEGNVPPMPGLTTAD